MFDLENKSLTLFSLNNMKVDRHFKGSLRSMLVRASAPPFDAPVGFSKIKVRYKLACDMDVSEIQDFALGFEQFVNIVRNQGDASRKNFENVDPFIVRTLGNIGTPEHDQININIEILGSALPAGGQCFKMTLEYFDDVTSKWTVFPPIDSTDAVQTIKSCLNAQGLAFFSDNIRWK